MTEPELSIIIPNYNGEALLSQFLPSVMEAMGNAQAPTELIVVDDASTDASLDTLKLFPRARVVVRETNGGFSKACNTGIAAAKGKFLLLLNSDVKLEPDFLAHYRRHFDDPALFAITPNAFDHSTGRALDGGKMGFWRHGAPRTTKNYYEEEAGKLSLRPPYPSFSVMGAYFFCDAEKIRALEGFDDLFSPFLFEDIDLSYRALKRGWRIVYEPKLRAHHRSSSTLDRVVRPFGKRVIAVRNRILFVLINIHSRRLMASFVFFLALRLLMANPFHWAALAQLLPRWRQAMARRSEERSQAVVGDDELFTKYDFRK
ncbi:MAG: glycosyltransferase family 2 protein [SAR324 cluster bacterium]|nr:glycosyltransferase family 2 protein [SAR324 cluster bacterium]